MIRTTGRFLERPSPSVSARAEPNRYALWSPHRDSREVILWKSLLSFRGEPWHWVNESEAARWFIVDVVRGVAPDLTAAIERDGQLHGIALARNWIDLPAPCWTFFRVPLQHDSVTRWLDQLVGRAPGATLPADDASSERWSGQALRLHRWPDVNRYGNASVELAVACGRLLRGWTPYPLLVHGLRDTQALHRLLHDAQLRGWLDSVPAELQTQAGPSAPVDLSALPVLNERVDIVPGLPRPPAPAAPPPAPQASESRRWGLLRRLWQRYA